MLGIGIYTINIFNPYSDDYTDYTASRITYTEFLRYNFKVPYRPSRPVMDPIKVAIGLAIPGVGKQWYWTYWMEIAKSGGPHTEALWSPFPKNVGPDEIGVGTGEFLRRRSLWLDPSSPWLPMKIRCGFCDTWRWVWHSGERGNAGSERIVIEIEACSVARV